tara:strand:- start:8960 stop:10285 length:1326 start_codon:yes stop_codon:yes gene_type:complete
MMAPHSLESEKRVLSAMANDPSKRDRCMEMLVASDFYSQAGRAIFNVFTELKDSGNLVSVTQSLIDSGDLDLIGGSAALMEMIEHLEVSDQFLESAIKIVKDKSALRCGGRIAEELKLQLETATTPEQVRELVSKGLSDISKATLLRVDPPTIEDIARLALQRWKDRIAGIGNRSVPTPWPSFNKAICGGIGERYYVISAPTGGGKSTLAMNLVTPMIDAGKDVIIYSYEMSGEDNIDRLSAMRANINPNLIFNPESFKPTETEIEMIVEANDFWAQSAVDLRCDPNITVDQISIEIRKAVRERDIGMIVVDYIQLVPVDGMKEGIREQVVAHISRTLRNISLEHGIAVVALSQTNDDGKMRESRSIANDAEVILNVTTDGIFVDKQRNGPAKVMLPICQGSKSFLFVDDTDQDYLEDAREVETQEEHDDFVAAESGEIPF